MSFVVQPPKIAYHKNGAVSGIYNNTYQRIIAVITVTFY
jgi:hypothetical protein